MINYLKNDNQRNKKYFKNCKYVNKINNDNIVIYKENLDDFMIYLYDLYRMQVRVLEI